jgi:hypothetical protein
VSAADAGPYVRRAGTGTLADGALVTWSLAEGARGRRWRWTVASGGALRHVGLLELDVEGRFARLELETLQGMLTLHPDADRGSAHGNIVRPDGGEPLDMRWSDAEALAIDGDPFGSAVARWRGRGWVVGTDLTLRRGDGGGPRALELDDRGIPRLDDAREFPLEV